MLAESLKPLTTWLHLHPLWSGVIAFLVAFTESLAIIGSIVPGSVTLTAIGILMGAGVIPIFATLLFAILGAFTGDLFSYGLGAYYHQGLKKTWPFKRWPNLIEKGETFFHRHGGKSILIGRFVGPIRAILPLVAGMLSMPFKRFVIADIISVILWAPAYMLPGVLVGAATLEFTPDVATRLILILLGALFLIWLGWLLMRTACRWLMGLFHGLGKKVWGSITHHPTLKRVATVLQHPLAPNDPMPFIIITTLFMLLILEIGIVTSIFLNGFPATLNDNVQHFMGGFRTPFLDNLMVGITFFGDKHVLWTASGVTLGWLLLRRHFKASFFWGLNAFLASGSVYVLKHLFKIPRPTGLVLPPDPFSFPSGHTTMSVAFYGAFYFLSAPLLPQKLKKSYGYLLSLLVIFIMLSRLYLGVHWFTDVLGGLITGMGVLLFSILIYKRKNPKPISPFALSAVLLVSLFTAWGIHWRTKLSQTLSHAQLRIPVKQVTQSAWWQQKIPLLPLVRLSRLNYPMESLNLQWAGSLSHIENTLKKSGWIKAPPRTTLLFLKRLATRRKDRMLPVWPVLYHNKPPSLVFTQSTSAKTPLLVLRLWQASLIFKDDKTPLWIGNIHYRLVWHHFWLQSHKRHLDALTSPFSYLKLNKQQYKTRHLTYDTPPDQKDSRIEDRIKLLLIASKTEGTVGNNAKNIQ